MKKTIIIFTVLMILVSFSCKRSEITDPNYKPKFTETYMLTIKTNPSTMLVFSSDRDVTDVSIKLTDSQGTPVAYGEILLYVSDNQLSQGHFGYFDGTLESSIIKATNSAGEIKIKYYGPISGEYIKSMFHISGMYISTQHNPITQAFQSAPIRLVWAE